MKRFILFIIGLLGLQGALFAAGPDDILGIWLNATGKGQIQVYKEGNQYYGKLIWLKEPLDANGHPKTDKNNPDATLRSKPVQGLQILKNFRYDKEEWNNGKIYDPQNGKEYSCYLRLKNANQLNVRGYIGIAMIGRTEVWTRIK